MKFTPFIKACIWGLGLLPLIVLTQNCGAQRFDTAKPAANVDLGSTDPLPNDGTKPIANCSTDVANRVDFRIKAGVVYTLSGQVDTTKMRLKIVNLPQSFVDNSWDFKVLDYNSATPTDLIQRDFQFEKKVTGGFQIVSPQNRYTVLNADEIIAMYRHDKNIQPDAPATPFQTALNHFDFLVDIGTGVSQVLYVHLVDSSGDMQEEIKVLMPQFYANPSEYAVGKPQELIDLHPLKSRMGETQTFQQWEAAFQNYCF